MNIMTHLMCDVMFSSTRSRYILLQLLLALVIELSD
jgi:hypothetical protein